MADDAALLFAVVSSADSPPLLALPPPHIRLWCRPSSPPCIGMATQPVPDDDGAVASAG